MPSLFQIPECAATDQADSLDFPAGGLGAGHLTYSIDGRFRRWRLQPGIAPDEQAAPWDGFYAWAEGPDGAASTSLADLPRSRRRLFPFQWDDLDARGALPIELSSVAFSPILPEASLESSLPLYVVAWRVRNPTRAKLEAALMLTWACAWPAPETEARFDFQHDKLCLTGSLGDPASPDRMGIAMPDLHSQGIYLQGIEPWTVPGGWEAVLDDFAEDGEVDPSNAGAPPHGAAAWVKFDLRPGEMKEVPFIVCWHLPIYRSGPAAGCPRFYTQFLEKRRPDNAIVWLAEQAVQDYGSETPAYQFWMQQIGDRLQTRLASADAEADEVRRINDGAALFHADTVWDEDGRFAVLAPGEEERSRLTALAGRLWPEARRPIEPR